MRDAPSVGRARFAGLALAVAVVAAACTSQLPSGGPHAAPTSPPASAPAAPTTAPGTTPTTTPPAGGVLEQGASGPDVLVLQQRLSSLGYWVGEPDGTYGPETTQAVVALQKAAGLARDGVFGSASARALAAGIRPSVRSTTGRVVEIDLARQLLLLVTDGTLDAVLDTSTGSGQPYAAAGGRQELAVTPPGRFTVFRQVDGPDASPLGMLWRPKYFNGGIALHGYAEVPPYPASHGCVRVSIPAMDWIWARDLVPVGTAVWVY